MKTLAQQSTVKAEDYFFNPNIELNMVVSTEGPRSSITMQSYNKSQFYISTAVNKVQFVDTSVLVHSSMQQFGYMEDELMQHVARSQNVIEAELEHFESETQILKFLRANSNFCRFAKEVTFLKESLQCMIY